MRRSSRSGVVEAIGNNAMHPPVLFLPPQQLYIPTIVEHESTRTAAEKARLEQ